MILPTNNQETMALALSIENGMKHGTDSEELNVANMAVDNYIGTILNSFSNELNQIQVVPVSKIHSLTNTQFWVLCYVGVQHVLTELKGNLNYTIISALETFKDENPDVIIDQTEFTAVDITNIVFQTELDLAVAYIGLEFILMTLNQNQGETNVL